MLFHIVEHVLITKYVKIASLVMPSLMDTVQVALQWNTVLHAEDLDATFVQMDMEN